MYLTQIEEFWKTNSRAIYGADNQYKDIVIPNGIFKKINTISGLAGPQKALVFSIYCMIKVFEDCDWSNVSNSEIKEMWGYSPINKQVNFITKKGGLLEQNGLTKYVKKEIVDGKNKRFKTRRVTAYRERPEEGYFKISILSLIDSMKNEGLGAMGFYVYAYIYCSYKIQLNTCNERYMAKLSYSFLEGGLGISTGSVMKYIDNLTKCLMLIKENGIKKYDEFGDFVGNEINSYKPTNYKTVYQKREKALYQSELEKYMKMKAEERWLENEIERQSREVVRQKQIQVLPDCIA
jgi:hypothetical protein